MHETNILFSVDKKNQLDVTFCILYFFYLLLLISTPRFTV